MSKRSFVAAPPQIVRWSPRSEGHGDCAITALEMACGVTYEKALAAAVEQDPHVLTEGLSIKEIVKAARSLGFDVSIRRKYDLDADSGILSVDEKGEGHVVYLWEGRILEPKYDRRQLWLNPRDYLAHYGSKAGVLVKVEENDDQS